MNSYLPTYKELFTDLYSYLSTNNYYSKISHIIESKL